MHGNHDAAGPGYQGCGCDSNGRGMRILFTMAHTGYVRHFSAVVKELCRRGHSVEMLFPPKLQKNKYDGALQDCLQHAEGLTAGWLRPRRDVWHWILRSIRETINYAWYLRHNRASPCAVRRQLRSLPLLARAAVGVPGVRGVLSTDKAFQFLRRVEPRTPPDRAITRLLSEKKPDVVFASPFILRDSEELEYVKAANALNIPTIVAVASWDNLTTKGTFQLLPKVTLVWNEALAREVVELHEVPDDTVCVTGSPTFDEWFNLGPQVTRSDFCSQVGVNPDRPLVLYLCSSTFICRDEHLLVEHVAKLLLHSKVPGVNDTLMLVRPHPLNASIWKRFAADNVIVWPQGGDPPDNPVSRQRYYDSLYHCTAVMGVNTSAFLEAAIVDKPCICLLSNRYRLTQSEMAHFHHLLNGNFLEIAHEDREVEATLKRIIEGKDTKAADRKSFIKEFLRPCGLEQPAAHTMASAIEAVASGRDLHCGFGSHNGLVSLSEPERPRGTELRAADSLQTSKESV